MVTLLFLKLLDCETRNIRAVESGPPETATAIGSEEAYLSNSLISEKFLPPFALFAIWVIADL